MHTSGVATRLAALRLYHCRRNVRDRDYDCDRGIKQVVRHVLGALIIEGLISKTC